MPRHLARPNQRPNLTKTDFNMWLLLRLVISLMVHRHIGSWMFVRITQKRLSTIVQYIPAASFILVQAKWHI